MRWLFRTWLTSHKKPKQSFILSSPIRTWQYIEKFRKLENFRKKIAKTKNHEAHPIYAPGNARGAVTRQFSDICRWHSKFPKLTFWRSFYCLQQFWSIISTTAWFCTRADFSKFRKVCPCTELPCRLALSRFKVFLHRLISKMARSKGIFNPCMG